MDHIATILSEIESFAAERGITPSSVTTYAVSSGALYGRLKSGKGCNVRTIMKIRDWIAEQRRGAAA